MLQGRSGYGIVAGRLKNATQQNLLRRLKDTFQPDEGSDPRLLLDEAAARLNQPNASAISGEEMLGLLERVRLKLWDQAKQRAFAYLRAGIEASIAEYDVKPETSLHDEIQAALEDLGDDGESLPDALQIQQKIARLAESVYAFQHDVNPLMNGESMAPRDAPRMPTDCMIHWIALLRDAAGDPGESRSAEVQRFLGDAIGRWNERRLSIGATREYFWNAAQELEQTGLADLSLEAGRFAASLPPKDDRLSPRAEALKYKAALNDNLYGRVYDSALAEELVKHPSPGMLQTTREMSRWLTEYLIPGGQAGNAGRGRIAGMRMPLRFAVFARPWFGLMPESFTSFMDSDDVDQACGHLASYLRAEKTSGLDCVAVPHLMMRAILGGPVTEPWHRSSDQRYASLERHRSRYRNCEEAYNAFRADVEARSFHGDIGEEEYEDLLEQARSFRRSARQAATKTMEGGITLLHQPPLVFDDDMVEGIRPATQCRPNFPEQEEEHRSHMLASWVRTVLMPRLQGVASDQDLTALVDRLGRLEEVRAGDRNTEALAAEHELLKLVRLLEAVAHTSETVRWTENALKRHRDELTGDEKKHIPLVLSELKQALGRGDGAEIRACCSRLLDQSARLARLSHNDVEREWLERRQDELNEEERAKVRSLTEDLKAAWRAGDQPAIEAGEQAFDVFVRKLQDKLLVPPGADDDALGPNGEQLPHALQNSLAHGHPYGTDASGSTHLLLHAIADANRRGYQIDVVDALRVIWVSLNYDGGHSLQETLLPAHALQHLLQLVAGLAGGRTEDFLADYRWLTLGRDAAHMEKILPAALARTVDFCRQYSHYTAPAREQPTTSAAPGRQE